MIFPVLEVERAIQVGDKTRLSGVKSFYTPGDSIDKVKIRPEGTASYVDVSGVSERDWHLDWVY